MINKLLHHHSIITSEVFRILPEHFRKLATISGDLRRSPEIVEAFFFFFEAFPSFGRLKAIPSAYLSNKCMVRSFKLSIFFKYIIKNFLYNLE